MKSIGSVIIVGGGTAGIHMAYEFAKNKNNVVEVTVVDRQDYFDWSVASPRMLVAPDAIKKTNYVMPTKKVLEFVGRRKDGSNHTKFVQGAVSKISSNSITLENGRTLEADAIIIAIGGQYTSPGSIWKPLPSHTTTELRVAAFRDLNRKAADAQSIVVVGAGPAGVEIAGELKNAFPHTVVTLVGNVLMRSSSKNQERVKHALEKIGVVIKEGYHVDADSPDENGNVVTREGETIAGVDLVLKATGFTYAGAKLADDALKKDVNERGQFNCRPTLQLQSCDSVFAIGDILSVPEGYYADVKGSMHAEATASTAAKNVVKYLKKKELKDFRWSKHPVEKPVMTTLSPNTVIADLGMPNFIQDFIGRKVKGDYYIGMKQSKLGKGSTW